MIQKSIENLTQIDQGSNKEKKELDFIALTFLEALAWRSLTARSKKKVQTRLIKSDQDAMPRRLFYKKGLYIV